MRSIHSTRSRPVTHSRHRVLDLQTGVHFEKVEIAVRIDNELHSPRRVVAHRVRQRNRLLTHSIAHGFVHERRGRFFDDFLVATLQRALAFPQMHDVLVLVSQHLNFDVPWLVDVAFEKDARIAEGRLGLVCGSLETLLAFGVGASNAHPFAPAPGARLEHHGVSNYFCHGNGLLRIFDYPGVSGNDIYSSLLRDLFRGDLVAHAANGSDVGANECHTSRLQRLCKLCVLRKKTVTGVNRVGT